MLEPRPKSKLSPDQEFTGAETPFSIGEFWQWAFSDLQENITRGVLAEFLVAKALGISLSVRQAWDDYDLETEQGLRVEVKASGYLQAWPQQKPSAPQVGRLKALSWDDKEGYSAEPQYRADVYVFAVHTAKRHEDYDMLDLAQWEFYAADCETLARLGTTSIGLSKVRRIAEGPVVFSDLKTTVSRVSAKA